MTSDHDYRTTSTGGIDYAYYTRRAHDIRSREARKILDAIARGAMFLAARIWRQDAILIAPVSRAPVARVAGRAPMRTPAPRTPAPGHVRPVASQADSIAGTKGPRKGTR